MATFLNSMPIAELHIWLVVSFVLLAGLTQCMPIVPRRRASRPLAFALSDAILVGSRIDHSSRASQLPGGVPGRPTAVRPIKPTLGEMVQLNEEKVIWGFSIQNSDEPICTFAYSSKEDGQNAYTLMKLVFNESIGVYFPNNR